jgi:hypothetical protein
MDSRIVVLVSMFRGLVPPAMGIVYAIWPSKQRLALMRPWSLATIFAVISGTMLGLLNVRRGIGVSDTLAFTRVSAMGLAESLGLLRVRLPDGGLAVRRVGALAAPLHS